MRVVIVGASGRMGLAITRAALEMGDVMFVGAIDREGAAAVGRDLGELAGLPAIGTRITTDLTAVLGDAEVVIDFSAASASRGNLAACANAGVPIVIGTTGLDAETHSAAALAAQRIPVLIAANTSLGVTMLLELVRQAARSLPTDFDIEIVEAHHRHKQDAPSGTALALGQAASDGRDIAFQRDSVRYHVDGGARPAGEIGYAVIRGGDVVGDHTVAFLGAGERVLLSHQATDRAIFARGALQAAKFLCEQSPGRYEMGDVIRLKTRT
jgi:4-hydroxy-tetrahydrodipicolinate reductase